MATLDAPPRVTLILIGAKIDTITETLDAHVIKDDSFQEALKISIDGYNDVPGLRGRIDRLEQSKRFMEKILWILITATAGLISSVMTIFITRQ